MTLHVVLLVVTDLLKGKKMSRSFPKDLKMSSQENSGFYNGTNFVGIHCKMHKQDVTDNECTDSNVFVKCERSEQFFEFGGK